MSQTDISQLVKSLLDKFDWEEYADNAETWLRENSERLSSAFDIKKEWIIEHASEIKEECINQFKQLSIEFSEGLHELYSVLKDALKDINSPTTKASIIKKVNVELLNELKLKQVIKENIVAESNQAAVYLKRGKNSFIFYICYLKDQKIIENDKNRHIILVAEGMTREIEQYFNNSPLIILK